MRCMQVMLQRHNMLQRQVMLLRAASEPVTHEDRARLEVCRPHTPHTSLSALALKMKGARLEARSRA